MSQDPLPMTIYAFIPARYGSSRFPGKPLALIAGKPMIQRVYEQAAACPELESIYVATDDERIRACVQSFGGRAVLTGGRHRSGTDRICEAADISGLHPGDIVVNIQGDQPLFDPSIVSELIQPLREDPSVFMATLMWRMAEDEDPLNPNHVKVVVDKEGFALYFSRSPIPHSRASGLRPWFYKHLGFYAFTMESLKRFTRLSRGVLEQAEKLEQLRGLEHGYKIRVVETRRNSVEVDVPQDIHAVEEMLHRLSKK